VTKKERTDWVWKSVPGLAIVGALRLPPFAQMIDLLRQRKSVFKCPIRDRARLRGGRHDSSHCPVRARRQRCGGRSFFARLPDVEAAKADSLESLVDALDGAEILHVYNSAFTPEFARLVRDKGQAPKWIQFTTVRSGRRSLIFAIAKRCSDNLISIVY